MKKFIHRDKNYSYSTSHKRRNAGLVILSIIVVGAFAYYYNFYNTRDTALTVMAKGQEILDTSYRAIQERLPKELPMSSKSRNPVSIYGNCETSMLTDRGRTYQTANVDCYEEGKNHSFLCSKDCVYRPIKVFKFSAPKELENTGLMCVDCRSKVYVYGQNDFELGLFDEVGEKKYSVRLWELPA